MKKFFRGKFAGTEKRSYLCTRKPTNGTMAEWLGNGLQNRAQQFDSAWYLFNPASTHRGGIF